MTVSTSVRRQYLDAMGIQVWEERGVVPVKVELAEPKVKVGSLGDLEHGELFVTVQSCKACGLSNDGAPKISPVARSQSPWFVVGDVPLHQDNRSLSLFSPKALQLFNDMLLSVGENPQTTYQTTRIKCAQSSIEPTNSDYAYCQPFLIREIELIKPKVVLLLGEAAAQSVIGSSKGIDELRGKVYTLDAIGIPCVVTYHPDQLLQTPLLKKAVWDDIRLAKAQV
ncbi:MAG: hypothetical protein COB26_10755 [Piscirickettsiaceae bacterium]|nr:MAG: hypothetical protein COB26_10755 [Piscirickettsiaceae bacterium]